MGAPNGPGAFRHACIVGELGQLEFLMLAAAAQSEN